MKIIDDRGKLFGVINIFDLLALMLIFVMLTPTVIFKYKDLKNIKIEKKEDVPNYSHVYKDIKARSFLINEVANRIKKGDHILDSSGNLLWQITDIISDEPAAFDLAGKKGDASVVVDAMKNSNYNFSNDESSFSLGSTSYFVGDKVKLPSLRRVVIAIKILCRIEKNGAVSIAPPEVGSRALGAGATIRLAYKDYIADFIITDIF